MTSPFLPAVRVAGPGDRLSTKTSCNERWTQSCPRTRRHPLAPSKTLPRDQRMRPNVDSRLWLRPIPVWLGGGARAPPADAPARRPHPGSAGRRRRWNCLGILRRSAGYAAAAAAPSRGERKHMKRILLVLGALTLVFGVSLLTSAAAQEPPLCGPPGEEVPATIVGAGNIQGTPGNDVIVGSPAADRINGGLGDDIICSEGGNDDVNGGPGADSLLGDELDLPPFLPSNGNNDDRLDGGPGNDTVAGLGGNDTLVGGPDDDTLIGFGGDDDITSGPGADTAFGGPGEDHISGDPGNDTLFGNFGSDVITGGPGDDFIDGDNPNPGPPPIPPGGNNDDCTGGPGADVIQNCEVTTP